MELERQDLRSLDAALGGLQLHLIGAAAVALSGIERAPHTLDLDLAVRTRQPELERLLRAAPGWSRGRGLVHRWVAPSGALFDLLAVDDAAVARGSVEFSGTGARMSVRGFGHLLDGSGSISRPELSPNLHVATLPCVFLLKVVALLERPERRKDLQHLLLMMERYLSVDDDRRYSGPAADAGHFQEEAGTWWLGRDLGALVTPDEHALLSAFVARMRDGGAESAAAAARAPASWGRSVREVRRRFGILQTGVEAGRQPRWPDRPPR